MVDLAGNPERGEITELLGRWQAGDAGAGEAVVERAYGELRRLASGYMWRERPGHTLQATALVNEALLRLLRAPPSFNDRAHFFRAAARAMRRILIDQARRLRAGNRIPPGERLPLEQAGELAAVPRGDLLDLDRALNRLAGDAPELVRVVELRCFVGLTIPEVAELLAVSEATVSRQWRLAKSCLYKALAEAGSER